MSARTLFATALAPDISQPDDAPDFIEVLMRHAPLARTEPIDLTALTCAVADTKHRYQSCKYRLAADELGLLLHQLHSACQWADGDEQVRANRLAADAYQVAGSILIKRGDLGMAVLAADRSMNAAVRCDDPVAVAASARIVTHTLMDGGHFRHATRTAAEAVERLTQHRISTPAAFSVAGALLLRGALAAARNGDRGTTTQFLSEAEAMAIRLGKDANERWTAFGPTNVLIHRVSAAVNLGDAGQAVAYAHHVPLDKVPLAERRASLFIDVARALTQWGKPERAYRALLAAEDTAPEEIRTRPVVHRLVDDLLHGAPPSLSAGIRDLAERIGVL